MFKNGKPLSISDQKSSDKVIENNSQNQNQDGNVADGIDFTRNNNVNDVSIKTAEECTNMQFHESKSSCKMLELNNSQSI